MVPLSQEHYSTSECKRLHEHGLPAGQLFRGAAMLLALGMVLLIFKHKARNGLRRLAASWTGQVVAAGADNTADDSRV